MNLLRKYKLHLLLLAVIAFLFSWGYYKLINERSDIGKLAKGVEEKLNAEFQDAMVLLDNEAFLKEVLEDSLTESTIKLLEKRDYAYGIFQEDSLIWWSDYQADIPSLARYVKPTEPLMRLENGFYKIFSKEHKVNGFDLFAVVMVPVKYQYAIENRYLQNRLADFDLPSDVSFSITPAPEAQSQAIVRGFSGEKLFYLIKKDEVAVKIFPAFSMITCLIGLFFALLFILGFARVIGNKMGYQWGLIFIILFSFITRYILLFIAYPDYLVQSALFSPKYYASSDWAPSLGDLFVNVLIVLTISWFVFRHLRINTLKSKWGKGLLSTLFFAAIFTFSFYIIEFTDTLVIDSRLSFDVNNFLSVDIYSWLGLVLIILLFASWFFVAFRLISIISKWYKLDKKLSIYILLGAAVWLLVFIWFANFSDLAISAVVAILFMALSLWMVYGIGNVSRFYKVIIWLSFSALITSYYLERFNNIKQRENELLYANLLLQKDYLTEFLFGQIKDEIVRDPFVRSYFKEDYITRKQLEDQVNFVYLKGHLSKYDITLKTFDANSERELSSGLKKYYALIDSSGRTTEISDLYYISQSPDKLEYLAILRVYDDPDKPVREGLLGRLVIAFKTKSIGYSTIYPELLLKESASPPSLYDQYNYAIFLDGKLVKRTGNYSYPVVYERDKSEKVFEFSKNGFHHLVYKDKPGKLVWISSEERSWVEPFSLFSFILLLNVILFITISGATILIRNPRKLRSIVKMEDTSFSVRLQIVVVGNILISFIVIGAVVILNIRTEYDEYHRDRLVRKSKQILSNMEYLRSENGDTTQSWEQLLTSVQLKADLSNLSEVHSMDFNIYDQKGYLIESSQPGVFERGLISHRIHPVARYNIYEQHLSQFIQNEKIGGLEFLAAYVPILDNQNNLIATVNLPYYAKEKNLKEEIANFLVYFINIYVILLAIAALLGIVISNSITRPISQIGERMRKIQLGARNIPLRWKKQDEIGRLIDEYNNMLKELEESARLLAQTERESAWREMARQVAHEIKNPLTPMRLSIQHLQRTASQSEGEESERIKRVSNTLLEQIDQLSHIASEFSNFAKMPRAENELLDIVESLNSVVHLYENEGNATIHFQNPDKSIYIFADNKQLNRVFQNLVKNAIESIPEGREGNVEIEVKEVDKESHSFVEVSISDNGIGISEEEQEKIFQPNFTTKTTGTGLGLPISKKIIEFAGGNINLESKVGQGSTFTVILPIYKKS